MSAQFPANLHALARSLQGLSYGFRDDGESIGRLEFEHAEMGQLIRKLSTLLVDLGENIYQAAWDIDGLAIRANILLSRKTLTHRASRTRRQKR